MNLFERYFNKVLNETMSSGSVGMAQSPGAPEATQFSADTYAPGDARRPKVLGAKKKRKCKKNKLEEDSFPVIRRPFPETVFLKGAK